MPPLPGAGAQRSPGAIGQRLPLRKIILGIVLVCSILAFFLILLASGVAILREAAPRGYGAPGVRPGLKALVVTIKHIVHHIVAHHR